MKISERCRKQIEDLERIANEFKVLGEKEPHSVVMWDKDFESISELYLAYKSLDEENEKLKDALEKSTETTYGLHEENRRLHNTINILRADKSNQSHEIHILEEENKTLCEKALELHTIKRSFEVLRTLYLGDYEDDEPF
jgi:septal ring factor EnvC (AmiA/AmiB activator)